MTVAPPTAPAPSARLSPGTGAPGPGLLGQVGPWLGYAGCFVGAGLVSGTELVQLTAFARRRGEVRTAIRRPSRRRH